MEIKENVKNVEEFEYLYDIVGWGSYSDEITKKALDNTFYSISLYENDKIVGYGRLIGDGITFLYIQDIMIVPDMQHKGYGTEIMNKLLSKIEDVKKENKHIRVYVGAQKGKEEFYKKFGFVNRSELDLGEALILNNMEEN